jgi:hypothetical protein
MDGEQRDGRTRVFLSYSRADGEFVDQLGPALIEAGYDVVRDLKDIAPGEPWRDRINALILSADAVVFVISPKAVASDILRVGGQPHG